MLPLRTTLPLSLLLGLALASPAAAHARSHGDAKPVARAAQEETDEAPVLPSRVAVAIRRSQGALERAEEHLDEGEYSKAIVSLRSVRRNMYRADRAATHQLNAPPPTDEDAEAPTTGPDSVIAVLGLEHSIVTTTAGLFDANSKGVVDGLTHALYRTLDARDRMLDAVIGLDPEGAGVDFADSMADSERVGGEHRQRHQLAHVLARDRGALERRPQQQPAGPGRGPPSDRARQRPGLLRLELRWPAVLPADGYEAARATRADLRRVAPQPWIHREGAPPVPAPTAADLGQRLGVRHRRRATAGRLG
jgi:hypothetical protein